MTIRRKLLNFGSRSTDLRFGCGAFSELSKMLAGAVGRPCRAFMVADADLPEDLVLNVRRSLIDAGYRVDEVALDGEARARSQLSAGCSCASRLSASLPRTSSWALAPPPSAPSPRTSPVRGAEGARALLSPRRSMP